MSRVGAGVVGLLWIMFFCSWSLCCFGYRGVWCCVLVFWNGIIVYELFLVGYESIVGYVFKFGGWRGV